MKNSIPRILTPTGKRQIFLVLCLTPFVIGSFVLLALFNLYWFGATLEYLDARNISLSVTLGRLLVLIVSSAVLLGVFALVRTTFFFLFSFIGMPDNNVPLHKKDWGRLKQYVGDYGHEPDPVTIMLCGEPLTYANANNVIKEIGHARAQEASGRLANPSDRLQAVLAESDPAGVRKDIVAAVLHRRGIHDAEDLTVLRLIAFEEEIEREYRRKSNDDVFDRVWQLEDARVPKSERRLGYCPT